jgi:ketosteroid isomerase-like protein
MIIRRDLSIEKKSIKYSPNNKNIRPIKGIHAMKTLYLIIFAVLITTVGVTFAQEKTTAPMDHTKMQGMDHSAMAKPAQLTITANAKDAVATVDRFNNALKAGQIDKAGAELDAKVLIFESGYVERSAAEYLGGHARGDAAYLKGAHVQLVRRSAQASGDIAWVASESELHSMKDGKMNTSVSTETMVLKRTDKTWKITHIHWSSHTKKAGDSH